MTSKEGNLNSKKSFGRDAANFATDLQINVGTHTLATEITFRINHLPIRI